MPETRRSLNHVVGCLAGGAVGDALGAPVEFMSAAEKGGIDRGLRMAAIPEKYLTDPELLLIRELAQDLFERMPDRVEGGI